MLEHLQALLNMAGFHQGEVDRWTSCQAFEFGKMGRTCLPRIG